MLLRSNLHIVAIQLYNVYIIQMQEIITLEDQVDEKERELQKKHVERLTKGECSPEAGMIFSDIVSGLERVADHATNIAFAITTEDEMDEGKTN